MYWIAIGLLASVAAISSAESCVDSYPTSQCLQLKAMCTSTFTDMARQMCKKTCGQCGPTLKCDQGYRSLNGQCVDIDECAEGKVLCQVNAECRNLDGSYECVCAEGYVGKPLTGCFKKIPCVDSIGGAECKKDLEKAPSACYQNSVYMTENCAATCKVCATAQDDGSCPVGYTFKAGICLDANECVQTYNGGCPVEGLCQNLYGSHTCKCSRGYSSGMTAGGQPTCVSESGRLCRANGDPHFYTFDGVKINYQGICEYTLAKVCDPKQAPGFEVIVKNERRYGNVHVSYMQYIKIKVFGLTIELHKGKQFMVNGVQKSLPWSPRLDIMAVMGWDGVEVTTDFGLKVIYDGDMRAYVTVPEQYRGTMCGICGNFDSNSANDMATADGTIVTNDAVGHAQIGNSYQVNGDIGKCEKAEPFNPTENCDATKRAEAEAKCDLLIDPYGPFKPCHESGTFDPQQYYEACVEDMCANSENYCIYLENFVDDCIKDTPSIDTFVWRTADFCPKNCESNSHYNPMMPSEPNTCTNPKAALDSADSVEGCECNDGYIMSGTECVAKENCGCLMDGQYFELGAKWTDDACGAIYECKQGNQIVKQSIKCNTDNAECKVLNGKRGCFCKEGATLETECGEDTGEPGTEPGDGSRDIIYVDPVLPDPDATTVPPVATEPVEMTTQSPSTEEVMPPPPSIDETDEEDKYFQVEPHPHPKPKPSPLGMISGLIPTIAITASSFEIHLSPDAARPNTPGAWIPLAKNTFRPYLQIDLGEAIDIHGLGSLGHPSEACWVQSYTVEVSVDGLAFTALLDKDAAGRVIRVFDGNKDQNTWKRHCLHRYYGEPVYARYVRFYPVGSHNKICMRVELYGFIDSENPTFIDFINENDVWTRTTTGCPCYFDESDLSCACCEPLGCQCSGAHKHQCVQCGYPFMCGIPTTTATQVDGWTKTPSGCPCKDDPTKDCACCVPYACQCGTVQQNQCVNCGHMEHCGQLPWVRGGTCVPRTCP